MAFVRPIVTQMRPYDPAKGLGEWPRSLHLSPPSFSHPLPNVFLLLPGLAGGSIPQTSLPSALLRVVGATLGSAGVVPTGVVSPLRWLRSLQPHCKCHVNRHPGSGFGDKLHMVP